MTLTRALLRAAVGAAVGALAGAGALGVLYARAASLTVDPAVTAVTRGLYPIERSGDETFFWAGPSATLALTGLDRHVPWSCTVRLRGARQAPATLPDVTAAADNSVLGVRRTTNEYVDWTFTLPPSGDIARSVITLTASSSFKPGRGDSRDLGFQIARWTCAPAAGIRADAPPRALTAAAIAAAMWGIGLGLTGFALVPVVVAAAVIALGQAAVMVRGFGVFLPYVWTLGWLAGAIAGTMVVLRFAIERAIGRSLFDLSRWVLGFSAAALYLKLAALLHPSKPLVDALFHAHRLDWVLGGKLFFTQPLYSGVEFPYAIGLYLFAAAWAALTHNHVALLDIVVAASEAIAGGLLYLMAARVWTDRLAGAAAVVLFSCVPLAYDIVGHANLTNAFGQSAALVAIATIVLTTLGQPRVVVLVAIVLVTTLALMSHVSTFALLLATLVAMGVLYGALGRPSLRRDAVVVFAVTATATLLSIVLYYGHFLETYRSLLHVSMTRAHVPVATMAGGAITGGPAVPTAGAMRAATATLGERTVNAFGLSATALGWPVVLLGVPGVWRTWQAGWRDRLSLAVAAWAAAFVIFMALGIAAPVDAANQRYAVEFVGRAVYATYPAAVLLAGRGIAWAWRGPVASRCAAVVIGLVAVVLGVQAWLGWLA